EFAQASQNTPPSIGLMFDIRKNLSESKSYTTQNLKALHPVVHPAVIFLGSDIVQLQKSRNSWVISVFKMQITICNDWHIDGNIIIRRIKQINRGFSAIL